MNYRDTYNKIINSIVPEELLNDINTLTTAELKQTQSAKIAAAEVAAELLRKAGLQPEMVNFPTDGKSVFQDKFMPYAWECSKGKLTVIRGNAPFADPVIADYERHPFHIIQGSPALPEEGKYFKLINYYDLLNGADTEDTLCLLPAECRPAGDILRNILELGCEGVVSDYVRNRWDAPRSISWANGNTMSGRWHFSQAERSYLGFSVSPETGDRLREALRKGAVTLKAECDGRLFESALPTVTATVKGRSPKEVWLLSHLYEPLADDNSSGVCACIAIAGTLNRLINSGAIPPPEYTLRVVFSMEFYGFAAFTEQMKELQVIGGVNMDGMPLRHGENSMRLFMSPPPLPSAGNAIMRDTVAGLKDVLPWKINEFSFGSFQDDQAISDPTVGIPVLWPLHGGGCRHWHTSCQTVDILSPENLTAAIGFIGSWAVAMLNGKCSDRKLLGTIYSETLSRLAGLEPFSGISREEYARKVNFILKMLSAELDALDLKEEQQKLASDAAGLIDAFEALPSEPIEEKRPWFDGSAQTVITRLTRGLPYDFCRRPERKHAIATIYTPTGLVLAGSDGKKSLQQLIREAEYQLGKNLSEKEIKTITRELNDLERAGYISQKISNKLSKNSFKEKLNTLGIAKGDILMVHSAFAALGPNAMTPAEMNDALLETIGEQGTLLMPAFTYPYTYFEGCSFFDNSYRPASPDAKPYTGALVNELLTRPECRRDRHTTHSIAATGRCAEELLADLAPFDPPTGATSAWNGLVNRKGKILFIGSGIGCNTCLHYVETMMDSWYLGAAVIRFRNEHDQLESALIPQHLGGCRDFYKGAGCKFYRRAAEKGLEIKYVDCGYAGLHLISAEQLFNIGCELLKEDPALLLCDDPGCHYCVSAKARLK